MKKVLGYILMFFTVFVFVVGMGADPVKAPVLQDSCCLRLRRRP